MNPKTVMKHAWVAALGLSAVGCATASTTARSAPTFGNENPALGVGRVPVSSSAPDPTVTDGDKYHVLLENDHVRVLRYQDKPGAKTQPHYHAEFVLYALSAFRRRLSFPDGTIKERDFKPGDVIWMPEQVHTGENTGTTDTDVIIVENKLAGSEAPRAPSR
jgi:beta-alanine degradation protein BauB